MNKKTFDYWSRKDFNALPTYCELQEKPNVIDSIVVLPTRKMHESGYRIMDFALIKDNMPICRINGCADVVKIGGLGGYNGYEGCRRTESGTVVEPCGWSIDCLNTSGLIRLFCDTKIRLDSYVTGSTLELFFVRHSEVIKK